MINKSCSMEPLVTSEYCRITICPDCGTTHINFPFRVSLQFEFQQFLEIANAFSSAAQILINKTAPKQNVIKIDSNLKH